MSHAQACLGRRQLPALAQTGDPAKSVTVPVPFSADGTTNLLGRLMARDLASRLGGTFVVDNKPGVRRTAARC